MTRHCSLILCFLTSCAADSDPERVALDMAGRADAVPADAAPDDAQIDDAQIGDAHIDAPFGDAHIDAFIQHADAVLGPDCVAPVDGACPPNVNEVVRASRYDPEADCWQRAFIISCLYNVGQSPGEACFRRTDDGTYYWVASITCMPFPTEECHGDMTPPADAPECPTE